MWLIAAQLSSAYAAASGCSMKPCGSSSPELSLDASRADQLRCAGNGVVALQAAVALVELLSRVERGELT